MASAISYISLFIAATQDCSEIYVSVEKSTISLPHR